MSLLEVRDLTIHYIVDESTVKAVNGVSFALEAGETMGLVGETGAGKTTTALGIMRLIQTPPGKIAGGEILFEGKNLLEMRDQEIQHIRGNQISMIFQDPMTSLNPVMRVADQIAEVIYLHGTCTKKEAHEQALQMLETVGIQAERGDDFPHQFSGGMKQRVVIAIALACNPQLLIADEPTTALDVTIQAQVLEMMNELKQKFNTAMLLITHDLGVVAETCNKVAIMYAGEIIEFGTLEQIFYQPTHPYTRGLFGSIPSLDKDERRLKPIIGLMPDPANLPEGCPFHPRCPQESRECRCNHPAPVDLGEGHIVCCLKARENIPRNSEEV